MSPYEILEHTADIGLRAKGATLDELFCETARGLADIIGVWRPGRGERVPVELDADDVGALVVDWLSEIIYLHDARGASIAGVDIARVDERRLAASISLAPLHEQPAEGIQVKAVTYHQLRVERAEGGWIAEVYFDV